MTSPKQKPREIEIGLHKILLDGEDYPLISRFTWHIKKDKNTFYAQTVIQIGGKQTTVTMHRLITGLKKSQVDHRNRNGLDNRKDNLRHASNAQNSCNRKRYNSHGYRGVYWHDGNFAAQIQVKGKRHCKYGFPTAKQAARAYDEMSKEFHGEFGIRNFEK